MGHNPPRPENWPPTAWPKVCPTVGDMMERGWRVFSRCQACDLVMQTPLDVIIKLDPRGRKALLWGVRKRCRRVTCGGQVWFEAFIPELKKVCRLDETKITPLAEVMPKAWIQEATDAQDRLPVEDRVESIPGTHDVAVFTVADRKMIGFEVLVACGCSRSRSATTWTGTLVDLMREPCRGCSQPPKSIEVRQANVGSYQTLGRLVRSTTARRAS